MLTKEQEEQIEQIFQLKKSKDRECRLLGCAFLKQFGVDKMYVQVCRTWGPNEFSDVSGVKKVTEIRSAKAVIVALNNLRTTSGYAIYPGGNAIKFPVLKVYSE